MRALIAARYLMRAPGLRKNSNVDVFDIRAGDRERHQVFRLAGGGTRVTTNAPRMVDDLGPLNRTSL